MVVNVRKRPVKMERSAINMENYLLLLRKDELIEFWAATGQSITSVRNRPVEKIREAILDLPRDALATVLRERTRKLERL